MHSRKVAAAALACMVVAGCGGITRGAAEAVPFELPVGPTGWDVSEASWLQNGVLHVGSRRVTIGDAPTGYAVAPTGVYWLDGHVLMFTSATGDTQEVRDLQWSSLAISPDRSTLALLDDSHGPTDEHGTHALQVVVFDTGTGEQLYRTPAAKSWTGGDLADFYGDAVPDLDEVSDAGVSIDGITIDHTTGEVTVREPGSLGELLFAGP
ncbi:hypothetical protein [Nocardioides zeicaulis]|uniref:WD40 repeat domain-containing protein n=1 Tax=Nocardioides zeicaulis TaxID=1776857 RepID=A0ABV6E6G3_9ACTN